MKVGWRKKACMKSLWQKNEIGHFCPFEKNWYGGFSNIILPLQLVIFKSENTDTVIHRTLGYGFLLHWWALMSVNNF